MRNASIYIILLLLISSSSVFSGEEGNLFVRNYLPKEYRAHVQNWAVGQDSRGIMYFGNSDGLLEYDGVNWRIIQLPSKEWVRSMAIDSAGRVWVGGSNEIGYVEPSSAKGMEYVSLTHLVPANAKPFLDVWETVILNGDIFFRTSNYLIRYSNGKVHTWENSGGFGVSFVVNSTFFISSNNQGLLYLKGNVLKKAPQWDSFTHDPILLAKTYNNTVAFIGTASKGFAYYNPLAHPDSSVRYISSPAASYYQKYHLKSEVQKYGTNYYISTPGDGCIVINEKGELQTVINQIKGLSTNRLHGLVVDRHGFLWFASNNGISKVDIMSPITYWGVADGLDGNVESIIRFNNTLYVGTHQGIYYIDSKNRIKKLPGLNTTGWSIIRFTDEATGATKVIVGASNGIYELKKDRVQLLRPTSAYVYELYQSRFVKNRLFACTATGVDIYRFTNGELRLEGHINGVAENIRSLYEENASTTWLGTFRNGVVRLTHNHSTILNPEVKIYDVTKGLSSNKNALLFPFNGSFVVGSDGGLDKYNSTTDSFEPDTTLGVNYTSSGKDVFTFSPAANGNVWVSGLNNKRSETGYFKPMANGTYTWVDAPLRLIPEMMVFGFYLDDSTGVAWIGGDEGLFRYSPYQTTDYSDLFNARIKRVSINADSSFYYGVSTFGDNVDLHAGSAYKPVQLSYDQNSLIFNFIAIYYVHEEANLYSYYLEGYDKKWSAWQTLPMKEYTNLPEGSYVFKVKAKNIFGVESNVDDFYFTISPPWYRTIWADIVYVILSVLFVYMLIHLNAKRLKAANAELEATVMERTAELSEVNTRLEEKQAELEIRQEEITAQAELLAENNRELEKLSIVARETDNSVLIMDADTRFEWVNEGFFKLYKTSLNGLMESWGSTLLQASSNKSIKSIVDECVTQKKSVTYESFNTLSDGSSVWVQTTLTPIFDEDGTVSKLVAIESDITERKFAEFEIEKQRDELLVLNSTKDKFFRIIGHDLRNPFNNIMGFTELIIERISQGDTEKALFFANLLSQTTTSAYELLENLLTWSRSQSGVIDFNPEKVSVKRVLDYNVQLLSGAAQIKGIELVLELHSDLHVTADSNMLLTVVRNLVTNAIKFSSVGDSITLTAIEQGKRVVVSIADTGVGIPKSKIDKIFRVDGNVKSKGTANEPGTGLGLILCREFVQKNGGTIWVDSQEGKGSTFSFSLPKAE
ncbi:MAG: PAS domain-containing protein [Bacteroidales bacterium]|nr:PAS domain-containing protein [Bacteroidales bacterium]MBN2748856.1 PAS domain-containing protein [Bacteroidales bacterium]